MASADRGIPHQTDVRRRRRRWFAMCSCGWSEEAVSGFSGWSATRKHICDLQAAAGMARPTPTGNPRVRLLCAAVPEFPHDQESRS